MQGNMIFFMVYQGRKYIKKCHSAMLHHILSPAFNNNKKLERFQVLFCVTWHHTALWERIFKMNEEVDSCLSEKVSNLFLTWKVRSITVQNKIGDFSSRRWIPQEMELLIEFLTDGYSLKFYAWTFVSQKRISFLNGNTSFESVHTKTLLSQNKTVSETPIVPI